MAVRLVGIVLSVWGQVCVQWLSRELAWDGMAEVKSRKTAAHETGLGNT